MSRQVFYHATTLRNANKILNKDGDRFKSLNNTKCGSLGKGTYCFLSKWCAKRYAYTRYYIMQKKAHGYLSKDAKPRILYFKLLKSSNIFYIYQPNLIKAFRIFAYNSSHYRVIHNIINNYSNTGRVHNLNGALLDAFINHLCKSGLHVDGIEKPEHDNFGMYKKDYKVTEANTIELCIRNTKIIDYNSINVLSL